MKSGPAIWCALSLWLGSVTCPGIETASTAPVSAAPITANDQFFLEYPDLKDEADVVDEASRALTGEGYQATTAKEAADSLAAKARALLAERTPEEWQQKAVSLYPALGAAGSDLNLLFLKHYRELKASSPAFVGEPSWPVLLAKRCDDELRAANAGASESIPGAVPITPLRAPPSAAPQPDDKTPLRKIHRSGNFWSTSIGLLLLIVLTAIPGVFAFRHGAVALQNSALSRRRGQSQQPPPSEPAPARRTDSQIWRAALKHAAIIYVVIALPTSVHSLMVNSDLGFIDRMFVSLLVGSLFGLFITLPLYGIDTLWLACQKHPAPPATR